MKKYLNTNVEHFRCKTEIVEGRETRGWNPFSFFFLDSFESWKMSVEKSREVNLSLFVLVGLLFYSINIVWTLFLSFRVINETFAVQWRIISQSTWNTVYKLIANSFKPLICLQVLKTQFWQLSWKVLWSSPSFPQIFW